MPLTKKCFVNMPFGKKGSPLHDRNWKIYTQMIKPAVESCGYKCVRADELAHPGSIPRDIIEHLFESELVVADLTQRNANVFYELGVRHALRNCGTIPIIQEGEEIPFDVAFYRVTTYSSELDGPEIFRNELITRIKAFEAVKKDKNDNPVFDTLGNRMLNIDPATFVSKDEFLTVTRARDDLLIKIKQLQREQERALAQTEISDKKVVELNHQVEKLQAELKDSKGRQELKTSSKASEKNLQLRTSPQELSQDDVKTILHQYDFYCAETDWNKEFCHPKGKGINHQYEIIRDGNIVLDHVTGLMWQQSGAREEITFERAGKYVDELKAQHFAGFDDWRLPTLEEVMSLVEPQQRKNGLYIDEKFDRTQKWIWTIDPVKGASLSWVVNFGGGVCYHYSIGSDYYFVRTVRAG